MPELPQTTAGRADPKPRHVVGSKEANVLGRRPDRHYVLAHKGVGGLDEYLELGYEIERYSKEPEKDGCRIAGVKRAKPGEPIEWRGHVLVSAPLAEIKARVAEEQEKFDVIEKQIVTQRRGIDPLRGLGVVRSGLLAVESAGADFSA